MHVPASGLFLVASPLLRDPNFQRTVVLVCEHDDGEGTMGIVVNRPSELTLADALQAVGPLPRQKLWIGGPVQQDAVLVLHRGRDVPGARLLVDGIALGGEESALLDLLRGPQHADVRVFSGYSGWSAGQLASEMSERSWILCRAEARHVFDIEPEALWATLLRSLGPQFAYLADLPPDPRVN